MRLHGAIREFGMARDERLGGARAARRPTPSWSTASSVRRAAAACGCARAPGGDVFDLALAGRGRRRRGDRAGHRGRRPARRRASRTTRAATSARARQPGHRFFFSPEEVEPLAGEAAALAGARVLVAGIGNVFLGDDGFGVALAGRLARRELPPGVEVVDFGIRGMDLAYALRDGYDAASCSTPRRAARRPARCT